MRVCISLLMSDTDHSIVEYSNQDEAQHAIQSLSNTTFMGRQIFVREVHGTKLMYLTCRIESKTPDLLEVTVVLMAEDTVDIRTVVAIKVVQATMPMSLVAKSTLEM